MKKIKALTNEIYTDGGIVTMDIFKDKKVLDIGCGQRKLLGSVGMDVVENSEADVVHDASVMPWPFEDNSFDLVFANHFVEHVDDLLAFFNEVHRILKPGGRFVMQVPYFRRTDAYADITHRHFFTARSLDYVIKGTRLSEYHYTDRLYTEIGFWYGWPSESRNPLVRAFKRFISRHSKFYDQYLSLVFPMPCVTWELEVIK